MKSRSNTLAVASAGILFLAVRFVAHHWMAIRRTNFKRKLDSRLDQLHKVRSSVVRSWALRGPLRQELSTLEARFNDYFRELVTHLMPHERELVLALYQDAEMYLRRARVQRRLGLFTAARSSVKSADYAITRACGKLPTDRRIVWSEVCYV
jgi:hypothetical protein